MPNLNCQNRGCINRDPGTEDHSPTFKKCGACKKVAYCSKECQRAHWPLHKPLCGTMRSNTAIPSVDVFLERAEELKPAFEGTHLPAARRLILRRLDSPTEDSRRAKRFAEGLDLADVVQYAIEKWLEMGDKGAVVFNIKHPHMDSPTFSRLLWLPRPVFFKAGHPRLLDLVTNYDPEHVALIFFVLPAEDLRTAQVWSVEWHFTVEPRIARQVRELRREWDEDRAEAARAGKAF